MKLSTILFAAAVVFATQIGVEEAAARASVKESVKCKGDRWELKWNSKGRYWYCQYPMSKQGAGGGSRR